MNSLRRQTHTRPGHARAGGNFQLGGKDKDDKTCVCRGVRVCLCVSVRVCVWSYVCHAGNNRDTQSGAWQINKATLCKLRSHPSPFHPLHVAPINNPNMCKWQLASPGGAGSHYRHTNTHKGIAENIQLTHNMVRRIFQAAKKPLKGIFEKLHAKKCLYITKRNNRQACGIESGGGGGAKLAVYGELGNLDKQPKIPQHAKLLLQKYFSLANFIAYCSSACASLNMF